MTTQKVLRLVPASDASPIGAVESPRSTDRTFDRVLRRSSAPFIECTVDRMHRKIGDTSIEPDLRSNQSRTDVGWYRTPNNVLVRPRKHVSQQLSTILQTTDPIDLLVDVTTTDVLALPLLVVGVGLLAGTVGFVGVLAIGAVLEAIGEWFE